MFAYFFFSLSYCYCFNKHFIRFCVHFIAHTQQVDAGCIPPMCELLTVVDSQIIHVALNGLENILKAGDLDKTKPNPYAVLIEECYG